MAKKFVFYFAAVCVIIVKFFFVIELDTANYVYKQFLEKVSKGHTFLGECLMSCLSNIIPLYLRTLVSIGVLSKGVCVHLLNF